MTEKWLIDERDCSHRVKGIQKKYGKGGKVKIIDWNYSNCKLYYLDRDAQLQLKVYMSCSAKQLSKDSGEGKGGTWTNHFIAKGDMMLGWNQ